MGSIGLIRGPINSRDGEIKQEPYHEIKLTDQCSSKVPSGDHSQCQEGMRVHRSPSTLNTTMNSSFVPEPMI